MGGEGETKRKKNNQTTPTTPPNTNENKEKIEVDGIELFRLCLTDRTIQLLVHFATHFLNGLRDIVFWKKKFVFSIRLSYELALFVLNNKEIDWVDVLKKAAEDGVKNEVVLSAHIINEIWNGIIPLTKDFDNSQLDQGDFMRRMIPQLMEGTLGKIVNEESNVAYIWSILKEKNKLWIKGIDHLFGEKYLKNICTGEFKIDYKYENQKFIFTFLLEKEIFIRKGNYEKGAKHIKEVPGIYFFFYDESVSNIDCWDAYALIKDNGGKIVFANIGTQITEYMYVDPELFKLNLSEEETVVTLEINESILKCYKSNCIGINVVTADRLDLYRYCQPDRHYIIRT